MTEQAWEETPKRWRMEALGAIEHAAGGADECAKSDEFGARNTSVERRRQDYLRWADDSRERARALRAAVAKLGEA